MSPISDVVIGVVVSWSVRPTRAAEFEGALHNLVTAASRQPGHISTEILRGSGSADRKEYHAIYRFESEACLRAWEASHERKNLVARLRATALEDARSEQRGAKTWFDVPGRRPAPRSRMALLTWLGIWPLVSLTLGFVAPLYALLPFLARTAITSALLVLTMTYVAMPFLIRLAGDWLLPTRETVADAG